MFARRKNPYALTITISEAERKALRQSIREQTRLHDDDLASARCTGGYADCPLCVLLDLLIKSAATDPIAEEPTDPLLSAYDGGAA